MMNSQNDAGKDIAPEENQSKVAKEDVDSIVGSSAKRKSISAWLKATVDNKPWWAIILAAALAAVGSESAKNIPSLYSWGRSFFPIDSTQHIFIAQKENNAPIDGAKIEILDTSTLTPLIVGNSGEKFVTSRQGFATAHLNTKAGAGYAIVVAYSYRETEYRTTLPIEISASAQQKIVFDPDSWETTQSRPNNSRTGILAELSGDLPSWMNIAYGELGQREIAGPENNARVIEYLRSTNLKQPPSDEIDWSSAFVNWVVGKAGYKGTNGNVNRDWLGWGKPIHPPQLGCIAVFWRISPTDPTGHTGFYVGERGDGIAILGGNQSNSVSISTLQKSRFLGCRQPA